MLACCTLALKLPVGSVVLMVIELFSCTRYAISERIAGFYTCFFFTVCVCGGGGGGGGGLFGIVKRYV